MIQLLEDLEDNIDDDNKFNEIKNKIKEISSGLTINIYKDLCSIFSLFKFNKFKFTAEFIKMTVCSSI